MLKSLKVANYKNIGDSFIGFDRIEKFNILIGRNNIGKSILLSILDKLGYISNYSLKYTNSDVKLEFTVQVDNIPSSIFASSSPIAGFNNHKDYGESLKDKFITYEIDIADNNHTCRIKFLDEKNCTFEKSAINSDINILLEAFGEYELNSFIADYKIIKLDADRNLLPETESTSLKIDTDGTGATNLIRTYLHNSEYDFKVVEKEILEALNKIVLPDEHFDRIMCQEIISDTDTKWEIHLVNENGRIPLSSSGSGLRTILLVLIKLFLEASKSPSISITHLKKDRSTNKLITENVFSFSSNCDILNDLGIKASDILQSNGIIWVEGPSDRVYINKWIELASGGILRENTHYQILFYGGRLLAHLSGETTSKDETELIKLFLANRNSILVMDSDKRNSKNSINTTKKRIKEEFENNGSIIWVTEGREIENYLSKRVINKEYGINKQIKRYQNIKNFLNTEQEGSKYGDNYVSNKYKKSVALVNHMKPEDLQILDLKNKIDEIVQKIKEWNYIK